MEGDVGLPLYLFHQGTNYYAYDYLGCSLRRVFGKYVYTFRVWAPGADRVSLVSDFTDWEGSAVMTRGDGGVFEITVTSPSSLEKMPYKYRITSRRGVSDKGDPYARFSRGGADGASLVFTTSSFKWGDGAWRRYRKSTRSISQR